MGYAEEQEKYLRTMGIDVKSKVIVTHKALSKQDGWGTSWVGAMDRFIGKVGIVTLIHPKSGVYIREIGCYFPFWVVTPASVINLTQFRLSYPTTAKIIEEQYFGREEFVVNILKHYIGIIDDQQIAKIINFRKE